MDMLNKQEAKELAHETLVDNFPSPESYRQPMFSNGHGAFQSLNEHCPSLETENTSTRHSSGCDDSGVFLEDLPYTPESLVAAGNAEHCIERLTGIKVSEMRQYSIDSAPAGIDSDAEKSDDLGLASSSVDSADDLDGDPLPSTISMSLSQSPKKPPPVPPRKPITNGINESQKESPTAVKKFDVPTVLTPQIYSLHKTEKQIPIQPRTDGDSQKWKSEECLRSVVDNKWCQRGSEKSISVKDRIAMFSEMEATSAPSAKKAAALQRFASETNVKAAPSVESIHKREESYPTPNSKSSDFPAINRDTKWYSMYSLPLSSSLSNPEDKSEMDVLKAANSIPSLITATSSDTIHRETEPINTNVPLKVETEPHRYSDKPVISNYPQTQLTSSRRYSYGPYNLTGIRTTEDLLNKKNSASGLLSIMDSRKQSLGKLKGLVIPEKPTHTSTKKALPTIVSSDAVIANAKSDADVENILTRSMLSAASYKTMSLPRTRSELKAKAESPGVRDLPKLTEPPWKTTVSNGNAYMKYSPAFSTRTLDLSNALTSSLSPTPPSSITSPLSPPPSSPSSICSSNASSATSVATMQQNIFQFSLSHSKPVTPVLPEKPIMSPPSLPSDIEYEGDNSEDSSTSASPMISKMSAKLVSSSNRDLSDQKYQPRNDMVSGSNDSFDSRAPSKSYAPFLSSSSIRSHSSFNVGEDNSSLHSRTNGNYVDRGMSDENDFQTKPRYSSTVQKQMNEDNRSKDYSFNCNNKEIGHNMRSSSKFGGADISTDSYTSQAEVNPIHTEFKNGYFATSQEVQMTKFRAQPLVLNQSTKENSSEINTSSFSKSQNSFRNEGSGSSNSSDKVYFQDRSLNGSSCSLGEEQKTFVSSCEFVPSQQWPQNADLIGFRKNKLDSEDEDDTHSSLSHRTEDSRPTTDDYLSDATTDSFDKSLDPDLKPRRLSQQKVVLKAAVDDTDSVQKFKALAEKWEHRGDSKSPPPPPPPLVPAPRKESRSYSSTIPATSSFLSSIITTSTSNCSRTTSNLSASNSIKLPPSLLPRNKPSEKSSERKGNRSSQKTTSPLNTSKNSNNVYEPIWSDDRLRTSSLYSSKDFSDSGSSTDTGSSYSRKTTGKDSWPTSEFLSSNKCQSNDRLEYSEPHGFDGVLSSKSDNDVFASGDESLSYSSRKSINFTTAIDKERKGNCNSNDRISSNTRDYDAQPSQYLRKSSEILEKSISSNNSSRRRSSFEKESFDSSWNYSRRDRKSDLPTTRNLSKSQASLRDPLESVRSPATSYFSSKNAKSVSVSDIRKAFETQCSQNSQTLPTKPPPLPARQPATSEVQATKQNGIHSQQPTIVPDHKRFSSIDSTTSGDSDPLTPSRYGSAGSLTSMSRDTFGSMTSLASTASLMSPQDLQQLVDEANQSLEESRDGKHANQSIHVIVLQREVPAGSIGITLAGGSDYEVKEITVHKVISGSLADRDGRIRKGDRVFSINGRNLKGITHREALDILKSPRPEVVLVIAREQPDVNGHYSETVLQRTPTSDRSRVRKELRRKSETSAPAVKDCEDPQTGPNVVCVQLLKDNTGLGFSIEGGKDSPLGDRPLLIKRIFKGGVADKDGNLDVGDELISVNGQLVTAMTRTEAWNFLKKLPEEPVLVRARKQVTCYT